MNSDIGFPVDMTCERCGKSYWAKGPYANTRRFCPKCFKKLAKEIKKELKGCDEDMTLIWRKEEDPENPEDNREIPYLEGEYICMNPECGKKYRKEANATKRVFCYDCYPKGISQTAEGKKLVKKLRKIVREKQMKKIESDYSGVNIPKKDTNELYYEVRYNNLVKALEKILGENGSLIKEKMAHKIKSYGRSLMEKVKEVVKDKFGEFGLKMIEDLEDSEEYKSLGKIP